MSSLELSADAPGEMLVISTIPQESLPFEIGLTNILVVQTIVPTVVQMPNETEASIGIDHLK